MATAWLLLCHHLSSACFAGAFPFPGTWDNSFRADRAFDSQALAGFTGKPEITVLPDGRFLVETWKTNGTAELVRLHSDGSIDPTFNRATLSLRDPVGGWLYLGRQISIDSDGRLLVAGEFNAVNGVSRPGLARLNYDGSLDTAFSPPASARWARVAQSPSGGELFAVGTTPSKGAFAFSRLSSNGTALSMATVLIREEDPSHFFRQVYPLPDGSTLLTSQYPTNQASVIAKLNQNGQLDPDFHRAVFGGLARGNWPTLEALAVDTEGRILAVGEFGSVDGNARAGVVRLLPNGSVDPGFAPAPGAQRIVEGAYEPGWLGSVAMDPQGRILISGGFSHYNGQIAPITETGLGGWFSWKSWQLIRLLPDGSLDLTFGPVDFRPFAAELFPPREHPIHPAIQTISICPDGSLIVSGQYSFWGDDQCGVRGLCETIGRSKPFLIRLHGDFQTSTPDFGISRIAVHRDRVGLLLFGPRGRYALDSAPDLGSNANWEPVTTADIDHGSLSMTHTRTEDVRFYRLRQLQ